MGVESATPGVNKRLVCLEKNHWTPSTTPPQRMRIISGRRRSAAAGRGLRNIMARAVELERVAVRARAARIAAAL